MQDRRILDRYLRSAGAEPAPTLESDSMLVLYAHVRTGRWASVMPARIAATLGLADTVHAIPITGGEPYPTIGLVVPYRDPMTPLTAALVGEARRLAPVLDDLDER
jgi:DNA-binding transcriptional LysR family regulator